MPTTIQLPVLPLRDIVVFPFATVPLMVGRAKSLEACTRALANNGRILLIAQRDPSVEEPSAQDLFGIGVIAILARHLTLPDGKMKLLVHGELRVRIEKLIEDPSCFVALAEPIEEPSGTVSDLPGFSLADWAIDSDPKTQNCVAELQHILEDEAMNPADRLRALGKLIGSA